MTDTDKSFGALYEAYPRASYLWDNVEMLSSCRTPMLFVNWENDEFFAVEGTEKCASTAINAEMILIPSLGHSHAHGASIEEIFVFAENVVAVP